MRRIVTNPRRLSVGLTLAAVASCLALLQPAASSAACHFTSVPQSFNPPGWNGSGDHTKGADGCAGPWLSAVSLDSGYIVWVKYSGAYHDIYKPSVWCTQGGGNCTLDPNQGSNWGYNGDPFHVQQVAPQTYVTYATLNY
jgi:hypothetical protein